MAEYHARARAALDRGDTEEALKIADGALADEWEPSAARTAGIAAFRLEEFETAEAHFVEVTKAEPVDAVSTYYRGLCRERIGRPGEALAHYRRALELEPDMAEAAKKVEKLSGQTGDNTTSKRMSEFTLPETEEDTAEYQRRQEAKKKADIRAEWAGQPTARKVFSVIVILVFLAGFAWIIYSMFAFETP